jgi:hypothetical protein
MIGSSMISEVSEHLLLEDHSCFKLSSSLVGSEMWIIKHHPFEKFIHDIDQFLLVCQSIMVKLHLILTLCVRKRSDDHRE